MGASIESLPCHREGVYVRLRLSRILSYPHLSPPAGSMLVLGRAKSPFVQENGPHLVQLPHLQVWTWTTMTRLTGISSSANGMQGSAIGSRYAHLALLSCFLSSTSTTDLAILNQFVSCILPCLLPCLITKYQSGLRTEAIACLHGS